MGRFQMRKEKGKRKNKRDLEPERERD